MVCCEADVVLVGVGIYCIEVGAGSYTRVRVVVRYYDVAGSLVAGIDVEFFDQ